MSSFFPPETAIEYDISSPWFRSKGICSILLAATVIDSDSAKEVDGTKRIAITAIIKYEILNITNSK